MWSTDEVQAAAANPVYRSRLVYAMAEIGRRFDRGSMARIAHRISPIMGLPKAAVDHNPLSYCAICDTDRAPGAEGEERGGDWFCAACLETEPCPECDGEHRATEACPEGYVAVGDGPYVIPGSVAAPNVEVRISHAELQSDLDADTKKET